MFGLNEKNTKYMVSLFMILMLSVYRAFYVGALSPVMAIALFSGVVFRNKFYSYLMPVLPIFLGDLAFTIFNPDYSLAGVLGTSFTVYITMLFIVFLVKVLIKEITAASVGIGAVLAPVLFFIITNLFVWIDLGSFSLYPKTMEGLAQCYVMGLPFLFKDILATLLFSGILFGFYAFISARVLKSEFARI